MFVLLLVLAHPECCRSYAARLNARSHDLQSALLPPPFFAPYFSHCPRPPFNVIGTASPVEDLTTLCPLLDGRHLCCVHNGVKFIRKCFKSSKLYKKIKKLSRPPPSSDDVILNHQGVQTHAIRPTATLVLTTKI